MWEQDGVHRGAPFCSPEDKLCQGQLQLLHPTPIPGPVLRVLLMLDRHLRLQFRLLYHRSATIAGQSLVLSGSPDSASLRLKALRRHRGIWARRSYRLQQLGSAGPSPEVSRQQSIACFEIKSTGTEEPLFLGLASFSVSIAVRVSQCVSLP